MASFDRGRALVIGVGAYDDARWDVATATRDAQGLYEVLVSPASGGYPPGGAELLLDKQATREDVLAGIRLLAARCTPESVALISFTCHGAPGDDGLYYLATRGTRFREAQIIGGSGLHIGELVRALREVPARQLLLLVNACSSGRLLERLDPADLGPDAPASGMMLPDAEANKLLATGAGRAVITASRADQLSYFNRDDTHSYFGQALIDALKGGLAGSARRYLGVNELYELLFRRVSEVTRRAGFVQEPVLTVVQNVGPFPVALNPGATGDDPTVAQRPASDLPLRIVPQTEITALGAGATAINAGAGSTVTVDNSKLIDFGGATVMGGVNIGNVARGDIININSPTTAAGASEQPPDPQRDLPILRERVAVARNVDVEARDEAADKLDLALNDLNRNNSAKARKRLDEALTILRALDNGYIRSVVRKIEAVREVLYSRERDS